MKHHSHPDIIKRLKRAHGHLAAVVQMLEDGRSCVDLAQQLHAVEAAISSAKREQIHDHMERCLGDGVGEGGMASREALRASDKGDLGSKTRRMTSYLSRGNFLHGRCWQGC